MKRRRREEELEEEEEQQQEPVATQATPADRVLELQQSAGNRAVGAVLQRWAGPAMAALAPRWPKETELRLGDLVIPIESFGDAIADRGIGPQGGKREEESEGPGDLFIVLKHGGAAPNLWKAAADGTATAQAELVIPFGNGKGLRYILFDVTISAASSAAGGANEPTYSVTVSFKRRKFSREPPPPPKR